MSDAISKAESALNRLGDRLRQGAAERVSGSQRILAAIQDVARKRWERKEEVRKAREEAKKTVLQKQALQKTKAKTHAATQCDSSRKTKRHGQSH